MRIRPLTDAEKNRIKTAKNKANKAINAKKPVVFSLDGNSVILDYDKLKKLDRSLNSQSWTCSVRIEEKQLTVDYHKWPQSHKGTFTMYELPEYQTALLHGLPVVEVET